MGLCFMVLFSLCLPFWVKAPNPACFQGADLISCLLSEYAYQKKKKKKVLHSEYHACGRVILYRGCNQAGVLKETEQL